MRSVMKFLQSLVFSVLGGALLFSSVMADAQTVRIYKGAKQDGTGKLLYELVDADSIVFTSNSEEDEGAVQYSLGGDVDYSNTGVVVEGTPGAVGTIYRIPLQVRGKYGMKFDFKLPQNVNNVSSVWQLASFATRKPTTTNGFLLQVGGATTTPQPPYAQPQFNSWIGAYLTESTGNNYSVVHKPSDFAIVGPFAGDAAFSVRYKGSDTDVCMEITDNLFRIYHTSGNVDIISIGLTNNLTLESLTESLSNYNSIIEVKNYNTDGHTIEDLIKISNIPLVASYNSTDYEAFPSYVMLYDDKWHTAEIYFDASYNSGYDMLRIYIDGFHLRQADNSYGLEGDGFFDDVLVLGGADILVKDFKFSENYKSNIPNIFCFMNHEIANRTEFDGSLPSDDLSISYDRTKSLIDLADELGLVYVTSSQIKDYYKNGTPLPHNCWTIIHDDYYYLSEHYSGYNPTSERIKSLYQANNMKVSFGIIAMNNQLSEDVAIDIRRDKNIFEFLVHDAFSLVSRQGYDTISRRITDNLGAFSRYLWDCDIWVYSGGQRDINTEMMLKYEGNVSIAWWNEMFPYRGSVSKFSDLMTLPRAGMHDSGLPLTSVKDKIMFIKKHF